MKRFLKLGLATMLIASAIVATFAFAPAKEDDAAKFTLRIFQYVGSRPATAASVIVPANWNLVPATTFVAPNDIIENIRFDDVTYPLTPASKPDFVGQPVLKATVQARFGNSLNHNLTFNGITFYFTKL